MDDADRASIHFDKAALLAMVDDDPSLMQELLEAGADTGELIASLGEAIDRNDVSEVKRLAHKLKGAAYSLAFNRLAGLAKRTEENADVGQTTLDALLREIEDEWALIEALIRAELS